MAQGRKLGNIFVELGLDSEEFTKGEAKILQSAQSTSLLVEKNWRTLGSHSDRIFEAMKANATNAYNAIANNAKSSTDEITRAQKAAADKITQINEQQFGKQTSLITELKTHWIAASAIIYAAWSTISKAWDLARVGAEYEEQKGILDNLSQKYETSADTIVSEMAKASDGLIANADLMKIALGGIAKGLNPEQLINLASAAKILGDAVGVDATTALNDLTSALETGRTKGLKNYLGTTLDLESAFGDLSSKMTAVEKSQAMYAMTMITATELQKQQTGEVDSAADKMERLDAQYKNITLSMGTFFKTLVVGAIDAFKTVDVYAASVAGLETELGRGDISTKALTASTNEQAVATKAIIAPYQTQIDSLKAQLVARKDNEQAIKDGEAATKKAASETEAAEKAILEAIRKANIEIESIGKSQYDKDIERIKSEAQKYKDAGADKVNVADFVAKQILLADKKAAEEAKKLQEKSTEDYLNALEKETEEHGKAMREEYAAEKKLAADLKKLGEKSTEEMLLALEKELEEKGKMMKEEFENEKKLSIERITLEAQVYDSIKGYASLYAKAQQKLIEERIKQMKLAGVDEIAIAAYVREETYKIEQKKLLDSGEFFDGVKAGYLEMEHNQKTWAQRAAEVWQKLFEGINQTTQTFFVDLFHGQLKTAEDYFNIFKDAVINAIAQMIAQWIAFQAMIGAANLLGLNVTATNPITGTVVTTGVSAGANAGANTATGGTGGVTGAVTSGLGAVYSYLTGTGTTAAVSAGSASAGAGGMGSASIGGGTATAATVGAGTTTTTGGTGAATATGGFGAAGSLGLMGLGAAAWLYGMYTIASKAPTLISQIDYSEEFRRATGIQTLFGHTALAQGFMKAGFTDEPWYFGAGTDPRFWMALNGENYKDALDMARAYTPEALNMITGTFNDQIRYDQAVGSPAFGLLTDKISEAILSTGKAPIHEGPGINLGLGPDYWATVGAAGGIIDELIVGRGQRTGMKYVFGEAGPERLTPLKGAKYNENNISELVSEVKMLRSDQQKSNNRIIRLTERYQRLMDKWEGIGLPATRT